MDEKNLENSLDETTEEVKSELNEGEALAEGTVEEASSEVTEAAEEAEGTAEAAAEEVTEAAEAETEEAADEVEEAADEAKTEEGGIEIVDPSKAKAESVTEPKKESDKKLNKTSIIVIIICAVIVVACLIFVGFKVGWFDFLSKTSNKVELCELTDIQVSKDYETISDDQVEYYIDSILSSQATTETLEEGKVEDGDSVNIDYEGVLDGETEPFDGGSAEGYDLTIGSGSFIDGFEDGLIGKKVGDTVELNLTFPDDYSDDGVAGKDVVFTVTINSISRTTTPELTKAWVKEYSESNCPETYETVADFKEYIRGVIQKYYVNNGIYDWIEARSEVKSYDTDQEELLMEYSGETLSYNASMYGYDEDTIASMYGYSSAEDYNRDQAHNWQKIIMIVDEICKKQNITYTDEELDASIEQYMKDQGYNGYYTLDEFKEQSGETWLLLYTELEFKYNLAMDSLHDNVVYVDEVETVSTTAEETSAEETSVEETSADETSADETTAEETTAAAN